MLRLTYLLAVLILLLACTNPGERWKSFRREERERARRPASALRDKRPRQAADQAPNRAPREVLTASPTIPRTRVLTWSSGPGSVAPGKPSYKVTLDLSSQVLRIDVPEDSQPGGAFRDERARSFEPTLQPSFALRERRSGFLSAAELAYKAKQFDDGLYAAVEQAIEEGRGRFVGKRELLAGLLKLLGDAPADHELQAGAVLGAAAELGGLKISLRGALARAAEEQRAMFLKDAQRSKPLGFYTWSERLGHIFQQDRMLQTELPPAPAQALARALGSEARLHGAYVTTVELYAHLTNPFAKPDLRELLVEHPQATAAGYPILPPSISHEGELVKRLYGERPIPEGFNLAEELIRRIRAGKLSLVPKAQSGWYDHQVYALEPLVLPEQTREAKRLELTKSYRAELVGLFKAALALTRETHLKQFEGMRIGGGGLHERLALWPELSLEPLATYYLRRARSYTFVHEVLQQAFGAQALRAMRRLTPGGPVKRSLAEELRFVEGLFHGAYLAACEELGLLPEREAKLSPPDADLKLFRTWVDAREKDPDMAGDVRMMVPLFYDIARRKTKVWVVLGVTEKKLEVSFAEHPRVIAVVDTNGKAVQPEIEWDTEKHSLAYFVTAELYVSQLLDRAAFRAHCNRYQTATAILSHLQ